MLDTLLNRYARLLDLLSALALAVMVVLVFGNVVLRYGFNTGITVSEEMSRWLFLWLTFMGATAALQQRAHLGTDARLPRVGRLICAGVSQVAMLFISWLILQGAWAQMQINMETRAPVTGLSVGIFYGSGVLFGASALVIGALLLWHTLHGRETTAPAESLPLDAPSADAR